MRTPDELVGAIVGRYRLLRRIGSGSMGRVYEGLGQGRHGRVAVKVLHSNEEDRHELAARFAREARIAVRLDSENIVRMIDAGFDEHYGPYLVTEYLVGEDLATRLAREPQTPAPLAVHIAVQVARGLEQAHDAGVVHRDIKPANVFLTLGADDAIVAKVLDFGISKLHAARESTAITDVGIAVGTPRYMSPEQIEGIEAIDPRADVWGLAAVLYEMLAGRPAFVDDGQAIDVMLRILRKPVDRLANVAPWVPERLARVVEYGLVRDRRDRVPDAGTFAAMLTEAVPEAFGGRGRSRPRLSTIPAPCAFDDTTGGAETDPPPVSAAKPKTWLEGSEPKVRGRRGT
jgi:serine/threonine-protein kinase